jgi:hypothetical protein
MSEESDIELVTRISSEFDDECQKRHNMGAQKYGDVKFLEPDNNLFQMMREELVDAANYARYFYIRLTLMEMGIASMNVPGPAPFSRFPDFISSTKKD